MLLDSENAIIKECLCSSEDANSNYSAALKSIDTTFSEFSGCEGWLHYCADESALRLSLRMPAWRAVVGRADVFAAFKDSLAESSAATFLLLDTAEDGWDVSVQVPVEQVQQKQEAVVVFTQLRANILAAPLKAAIKAQQTSSQFAPCTVPLSTAAGGGQESFTVACQGEQVVCVFSTAFPDQTDTVLARVFLQELFDVRKGKLGDAPAVLFGREPPGDLVQLIPSLAQTQNSNSQLNYISIVLFPRHFALPQVFTVLPTLRDYLHYHLKCCKAYLHGRMRAKTADFLKILNRAKPSNFSEY